MAAIDFPASPSINQIFTAANGVSYRWTGVLWAAAARTMSFGDTAPATPGPGHLWWNTLLGTLFVYYADPNTSQWVPATPAQLAGGVIQTVFTETGALTTGTTIIPYDDTIPQITEGFEVMALAITPRSATSKLLIRITASVSYSVAGAAISGALFQDSTANALAAGTVKASATADAIQQLSFVHTMTSGTTSATTFRFRVGGNTAGTLAFNGSAGSRYFGGVMASSIVIQEVLP